MPGPLLKNVGYYPGRHQSLPTKIQTYSVEATNAKLRHYLARLARASCCFSRSLEALRAALKIFIFAWNRRQLAKRQIHRIALPLLTFLYP